MRKQPRKKTPGPKPVAIKIKDHWWAALKKSLDVKKPAEGWPK